MEGQCPSSLPLYVFPKGSGDLSHCTHNKGQQSPLSVRTLSDLQPRQSRRRAQEEKYSHKGEATLVLTLPWGLPSLDPTYSHIVEDNQDLIHSKTSLDHEIPSRS